MNDEYLPGQVVTLTATIRNRAGTLVDPDTVTCKVKNPAGTISTYTPTKDSVGVYSYNLTVNASGEWLYRFEGTGAATTSAETAFFVRDSAFD